MSRIGKTPIKIPNGVTITIDPGMVRVKGPKGELSQEIKGRIDVAVKDGEVLFKAKDDERQTRASWGLYRSLVSGMVKGVTEGYRKDLEIVGVGYRASKKGNDLVINIGYSHPVEFTAPEGITLNVDESTKISVAGADKSLVGLTAAKIRNVRPPEPYKGKGIRYVNEYVRRKAGKTGVKAV